MRTLPRVLTLVVAPWAAVSLLLTGCSSGFWAEGSPPDVVLSAEPAPTPALSTPNRGDDVLFVAKAAGGTLDLDAQGNGTLELTSVATMTWFSDRPDHDAGVTATVDALAAFGWEVDGDDLGEGVRAPNAVLTGEGVAESVVLELLEVTRGAGEDLAFTVATVKDVPTTQRQVDLGSVELFIDSIEPDPGSQTQDTQRVPMEDVQR